MKRSNGSPLGLYTIGIAALFLVGFLLLLAFGARTYRDAAGGQAENNESRALLSYLSTCVKSNDSADNIFIQDGEDDPVLVIADGSGYALHIYRSGGQLLEEYSAIDAQPIPENANVLGETDIFTVETAAKNTLKISTDAGNVLLHLRSGEGPE